MQHEPACHPCRPDRPGIQLSRTPALHEHEGDAQALRYLYRLIDADQLQLDDSALPGLLDAAQHTGFTGLNITYPFKQAILPLLDELSDEARGIGAVNTVVLDGKRVGHNTDCLGFAEGLRRGCPMARRKVVQMGAGGAGSAVAHALLGEGVEQLVLFEVDTARAQALVDNLNAHFGAGRAMLGGDLATTLADADGLVNTTRSAWPSYLARRCRAACTAVGGGDHLLPAGNRTAARCTGPGLPHWTVATWRCSRL